MEDPDERPGRGGGSPVRPLGTTGVPRETLLPLALLIAAFVIAIVQPWGMVAPRPPGADGPIDASAPLTGSGSGASSEEAPTRSPEDPDQELVVTCGYPSGWRAATLQHWTGRRTPIRSWIAVDPVAAAGPTDPAIPFAPVATDLVLAIGYCSPVDETRPPSAVDVEIWSVPEDGLPEPLVALERLEPVRPNALGGLWLPDDATTLTAGGEVGWAPGRYAIRVVALPFDRWLGVEIRDISGLRPTPSPSSGALSPSPTATASP